MDVIQISTEKSRGPLELLDEMERRTLREFTSKSECCVAYMPHYGIIGENCFIHHDWNVYIVKIEKDDCNVIYTDLNENPLIKDPFTGMRFNEISLERYGGYYVYDNIDECKTHVMHIIDTALLRLTATRDALNNKRK